MSEPDWMLVARKELGVREIAGAAHNERILEYLRAGSSSSSLTSRDEVPWCAGFVNWCLQRGSGGQLKGSGSLLAKSFLGYGRSVRDNPPAGAIVVFDRPPNPNSGHVGFFVGYTPNGILVLGGNQSNAVTIQEYSRNLLRDFRWPNSVPLPSERAVDVVVPTPTSLPPKPSASGFVIGVLLVAAAAALVVTKGELLTKVKELVERLF